MKKGSIMKCKTCGFVAESAGQMRKHYYAEHKNKPSTNGMLGEFEKAHAAVKQRLIAAIDANNVGDVNKAVVQLGTLADLKNQLVLITAPEVKAFE